jgi:hypothetical protein
MISFWMMIPTVLNSISAEMKGGFMSKSDDLLQIAKQAGYSSVKEFSEACGRSSRTLLNWKKEFPVLFSNIVKGVTK